MPSLTFDGRSFMHDGRRLWLVAGSVHYSRVPREQWRDRLREAKAAGLNTIETTVFWHRHEPRPGHFDFKGDQDLRHFVTLIGQMGMSCILRPGPYVGEDVDAGGLPAWLLSTPGVVPRKASGPFLEACSRYLTAVAEQVRDLQATSPRPGPIVLVQNESAWTCGDDKAGGAYLGELNRYLREAGITVPIINTNNLWQGVEGEIDCWSGGGDMLPIIRQLSVVRPDQPRLVELRVGSPLLLGHAEPPPPDPRIVQHRLAQILAAGAQYIIGPFHGGSNFGFWAGRTLDGPAAFVARPRDHAPLTQAGARGAMFPAVRRISVFASRFGRVLSNLDPAYQPIIMTPTPGGESGPVVVHATGSQGGVAFVFRGAGEAEDVPILLPEGTALRVPLPSDAAQAVAWCVFGASLGGRTRLDYSNLSVFTLVGKVLVCFGPAGAEGHLSIGGAPLEVKVPSGREPEIHEHEGISVVVCSEEQIDRVFDAPDAVYLNVSGLDGSGAPVGLPHSRHATRISAEGVVTQVTTGPGPAARHEGRITIEHWEAAAAADHAAGTSARYASIAGPAELASLGSPYGMGWYRVKFRPPTSGRAVLAFPDSGDRLHVFLDGEAQGVCGAGPGASRDLEVALKRKPQTLVVLAENLGRVSAGANLGEARGLRGHVWSIKSIRAGRPAIRTGEPLDILAFRSPLWEVHAGDLASPDRITWTIRHRHKTPLLVTFDRFVARALLVVNNRPVRFVERGSADRVMLDADGLSRGVNTVQLALLRENLDQNGRPADAGALLKEFGDAVSFHEGVECLTEKGEWAFARWEAPGASHYHPPGPRHPHGPTWWRSTFTPADTETPLFFEPTGLTKGQVYINGKHLGRYFAATATGRTVPHVPLYVPRPWLVPDSENTILVFDEHGGEPGRARLIYEH